MGIEKHAVEIAASLAVKMGPLATLSTCMSRLPPDEV